MNLLQTGVLATKKGTEFETSDGMPCGSFSKLEIGTKVVVLKANDGSVGIVIAKLPWADESSKVLSSAVKNQK